MDEQECAVPWEELYDALPDGWVEMPPAVA
jgi:hypothetical protein